MPFGSRGADPEYLRIIVEELVVTAPTEDAITSATKIPVTRHQQGKEDSARRPSSSISKRNLKQIFLDLFCLSTVLSNSIARLKQLKNHNRIQALMDDYSGQYSIRINDQWRVCFCWTNAGAEDVEIVDDH